MIKGCGIAPSKGHAIGIFHPGSSQQIPKPNKFINISTKPGSFVWDSIQKHSMTESNLQLGILGSLIKEDKIKGY